LLLPSFLLSSLPSFPPVVHKSLQRIRERKLARVRPLSLLPPSFPPSLLTSISLTSSPFFTVIILTDWQFLTDFLPNGRVLTG
jgi:hypothetical protein